MLKTARISGAGVHSAAGINTELQPFRMDIVADSLHAVWKLDRVRLQMSLAVTLPRAPTVINDNIFIAGFMKSGIHHRVSCGNNQILRDLIIKSVP